MKIWLRKGIAVMLSLIMVISVLTSATVIDASATGFTPRTTAPDSSNAYYYSANPFYQSGYGMPNCTCYAYGRAYELLGSRPSLSTGNAGKWWWYNKNNGIYSYGSTPKLGAIACWDKYDQNQGHVAVVEAIDGNSVTISESHYKSTFFDTRTISANSSNYLTSMRFLGYIYIGDFSAVDTPVDLGTEFYAYIINTSAWKPLINDGLHNANFNDSADEIKKIWKFIRNDNGTYTILSYYDNSALDVDLGKSENGTNVGVWTNAGTSNQQWFIYGSSSQYYFKSACSEAVLDMAGGKYNEGVNAQIWENNGTGAQLFQIWTLDSNSVPQNLGTDFYAYIINTAAWKPLVNDGQHNANFNDSAGEIKKIWRFVRNENGSYNIISYYDNNALDVDLGKTENGTDVGVWTNAGTSNQQWFIYGSSARYYFKPACASAVLDMTGGDYYEGVNAQIWENNGTDAQLFQIWTLETNSVPQNIGSDFYAYIINTVADKPLVNDGFHKAYFCDSIADIHKLWRFVRNDNGSYKIISAYDNNALDVDLGQSENGTDVGVWTDSDTSNQQWFVYGDSTQCHLKPVCSSAVLDMAGGEYYEGANAQIWENNGTDAQLFQVLTIGNSEAERIINSSKKLPGDANSDGKVNLLDAVMAQKAALSITTLDEQGIANADINGDGKITLFDAIAIQKLALSVN